MSELNDLLLGEFPRTVDERFRLSIPPELLSGLGADGTDCILTKERPGCLSLWNAAAWQTKFDIGLKVIRAKIEAGRLDDKIAQVQRLGRLMSTRQRTVQLAGRGRLSIPEGFREFLEVEPSGDVMIVGAAVCIEIWKPSRWLTYLQRSVPRFRKLFDQLSQ